MNRCDQGRQQLEATVASALEAAWADAGRRANAIVMAARLATAIHMREAAESAEVRMGCADHLEVPSVQAASVDSADAAALVGGGRE